MVGKPGNRRVIDERIGYWRERWELVFYCWRWLVVLVLATAEAIALVVSISRGRAPTFTFIPFW
jgi:hypothetical protein